MQTQMAYCSVHLPKPKETQRVATMLSREGLSPISLGTETGWKPQVPAALWMDGRSWFHSPYILSSICAPPPFQVC